MPRVSILAYRTSRDEIPAIDWLERQERATRNKALAALERLRELGHEARRPLAENLGEGIYELRVRLGRVNYRILFSFFDRNAVVLTHGLTKEDAIPPTDLAIAKRRKADYEKEPEVYLVEVEV